MKRLTQNILILLLLVFSQHAFSQSFNPLISFSVKSCGLDEALEKLFAEYELNVAFSKAEMSKIRIESYSCSYKSVEEVLTDLLKGTDYGFKKIGKQYVIRKKQLLEPIVETVEEEKPDNQVVVVPKGGADRYGLHREIQGFGNPLAPIPRQRLVHRAFGGIGFGAVQARGRFTST